MDNRYTPISMDGIDGDRYGIYRDGTVVNLEIPMTMHSYYKRGVKVIELSGFKRKIEIPIIKLLAMVYVPKSALDEKRNRDCAILIDPNKKINADNIKWVNKFEKKLINEIRSNEKIYNSDYAVPICKLLERGYDVDEICSVLQFKNRLYVSNIKNRRIHKDISKKYKF